MNRETHENCEKIVYAEESYLIQGAVFEVYKEMGCGFLEPVYHECLAREFAYKEIPFVTRPSVALFYKGNPLVQTYTPDFICYDKIVIELKAVLALGPEHKAQILNFLKATGFSLGLLVNFGSHPKTEIIRMANTNFSRFSRLSRLNNEGE